MEQNLGDLWKLVKDKKNVIGYSKKLRVRIKDGKEIPNTSCFRVYVTRKEALSALSEKDIIPRILKGIETDLVVKKLPVALSVDKTKRIRPVPLGVSIGGWNITAGSLGILYRKNNKVFGGTNAHIVTESPSRKPEEIIERRICQPGPYHDPNKENNVVGEYHLHDQIHPLVEISGCNLSKLIANCLNFISKLFGRKTRFKAEVEIENHQDLGLYLPTVEHITDVADGSLKDEPFIGHLFAGSTDSGIICKVKYAMEEGFVPLYNIAEVEIGDKVKGSSFWCSYETIVEDDSASITVGYEYFIAFFDDIIMVRNDGTIKPGWSGSGFRKLN